MTCGLCGYEFDEEALACHGGCPLASRCAIICCPHCGYQQPDPARSRLAGYITRRWGGRDRRRSAR